MASRPLSYINSDSSDLESDSNSETEGEPPTKRQKQSHNWIRVKCFPTGKEALDFVKGEKLWRMSGKHDGLQGRKISYNCKYSKLCGAKVYLLFKSDSQVTELYNTTSEHTHDPKCRDLTASTKEKVIQLISDGVTKPKIILTRIRECGLPEPPAKVLKNFLCNFRRKQGNHVYR